MIMNPTKVTEKDAFAKLLGIKITDVSEGSATSEISINEQHLNGMGMVHGGVIFTLGDMAFAAAANSRESDAVAINLTVNFMKSPEKGVLKAKATEVSLSKRIGNYRIEVFDENDKIIAMLQGTAYRFSSDTGK